MTVVIDASALMALLLREPGSHLVGEHVGDASISAVNLAEVLARMSRERVPARALAPKLASLGLAIVDFDLPQAIIVGDIREAARAKGAGLADCCCIALALHLACPVLTADRVWTSLGLDIDVRLIR